MNLSKAQGSPSVRSWSLWAIWAWHLVGASAGTPITWNGCECKKIWAEDGVGACDNYCCSPDSDPVGNWCMVEEQGCEDADWGYCSTGPTTWSSVPDCDDIAGWHDSDGDGCPTYGQNNWCTRSGGIGPGWHSDWGDLSTFFANGFTAFSACCVCGGGLKFGGSYQQGSYVSASSDRVTWSGCKCKTHWTESEELTCDHGCCNPDLDPAGEWCKVEDPACEDGEWGYCRPAGMSQPFGGAYSEQHGHCTDTHDWKDLDGEGCQIYAENAYCTEVGGYGLGWNMEWGTFSSFAPDGWTSATNACCVCGGGTRDDNIGGQSWAFGGGTDFWNDDKVRSTWTGCACKKERKESDVLPTGGGAAADLTCTSYCCNPDQDPVGAWCIVEDKACEDADWGYCQTSGLGTIARPGQEASRCEDYDWSDPDGDDCLMYKQSMWCNATGGPGPGWHDEWGRLQSFIKNDHTALTACCACGGGKRRDDEDSSTWELLANMMGEEVERMWRVTLGPCKRDDDGCITSGNYPGKYNPREQCQIAINPKITKPIEVKDFHTEFNFDVMRVNGVMYSGERGPAGIIPSTTIHWGSDAQEEATGWKMCPRGEVQSRNPAILVLKIIGITALLIIGCCCCCVIGLWVHAKRTQPTGDGLGAGPKKIGKKYALDDEDA